MKTTILKACAAAWLLLAAVSCEHDKLPVYEDVDRIYFAWATSSTLANQISDKVRVSMGYDVPQKADTTVFLTVLLMGKVSDEPRPIAAEIIPEESSAIPGEDLEILPELSFMLPNSQVGVVGVKVKNTDKTKQHTLSARIRLVPNAYFYTDMSTVQVPLTVSGTQFAALEMTLEFDAKGECPNLWLDSDQIQDFFKEWSKVKEEVIYEQTGVTREMLMYDAAATREAGQSANDVANARIPGAVAMGICIKINRYLLQYKNGTTDRNGDPKPAGEPLYDEFGREVKVAMSDVV